MRKKIDLYDAVGLGYLITRLIADRDLLGRSDDRAHKNSVYPAVLTDKTRPTSNNKSYRAMKEQFNPYNPPCVLGGLLRILRHHRAMSTEQHITFNLYAS